MRRYFWIMQPAARTRQKRVGSGWSSAWLNVRLNTRRFVLLTAKTAYQNAGRIDSPCFPPIYSAAGRISHASAWLTMTNLSNIIVRTLSRGRILLDRLLHRKGTWTAFGNILKIGIDGNLRKFAEIWLSSSVLKIDFFQIKTRRNFDDSNYIFSYFE